MILKNQGNHQGDKDAPECGARALASISKIIERRVVGLGGRGHSGDQVKHARH